MINDILMNIISMTITVVIIPLISLLGTKLIQWINTKISNVQIAKILTSAYDVVLKAVKSVSQTYVESLKKEGKFDKESQQIALEKAKEVIACQMSDDVKEFITKTYGNLDNWITIQIEAAINTSKNK